MDQPSKKSRLAASLFAFFLGAFGAHRFYAGKTGSAIAQLLLTLSCIGIIISGPWSFIDLIFIIAGGFRDGDGLTISDWNPGKTSPQSQPQTHLN
jgi:TM2 domain-containing membrane protein YozV